MVNQFWTTCLFLGVSHGVMAQTTPSAGGQVQQLPAVPRLPPAAAQVQVQSGTTSPSPALGGATFVIKRLNITGNSAYPVTELLRIAGFEAGRTINLQVLNGMADKITAHYRQAGFLVARAYLPAQEVKDGVVTMAVLEGQYGQVQLNNTSTLKSALPLTLLSGLNPGDAILLAPLEERLLLLSDVPGVNVRSTLVPGASVGLSDLLVEVKPGDFISGSVDADNAGNRYTGENRIGATLYLNNPTSSGDLITLRGLTSGAGLNYGRVAYQFPVGRGRLGVAYSDLAYALGHEFKALDANGHARITTVFGGYPLIRSRQSNLNLGLSWDNKVFQDRLDAVPSVTDKRVQVATASLSGERRDTVGAGGQSNYSLAWSTGQVDIQTLSARNLDSTTAASNGHYNKLAFAVSRMQQVSTDLSFWASLSGQLASKNLDVSEKMELGGMSGVRAYPEGEAYADEGYLLTLEARKQLLLSPVTTGQVHVAAFVDLGVVRLNQNPWTTASNSRHLSGAGLGVYWTQARDFSVKAFYARKLGSEAALSAPDKSGRFWLQAVKYF